MANEKEVGAALSPELVAQLRAVRELMLEQYQAHRAGAGMPPEQSLALRSQISYITGIVEPGIQEMWSDYSPAEKDYLEELSLKRAQDANHISMAALGPLSLPAYLVEKMNAPPHTVAKFIELGFNLAAAAEINQVAIKGLRYDSFEIRPTTKVEFEFCDVPKAFNLPHDGKVASNKSFYRDGGVTSLAEYKKQHLPDQKTVNPNAYKFEPLGEEYALDFAGMNNLVDSVLVSVKEAEPILNWLNKGNLGTLSAAMGRYLGKEGLILADIKAMHENSKIVDEWLDHYASNHHGAQEAIGKARLFTWRLLNDISSNGEVNPAKLKVVIQQVRKGEYLNADEIAALEYTRQMAHQRFVDGKVSQYVDLANKLRIEGEILQNGIQATRDLAEKNSPYQQRGAEQDGHPPEPPEPGIER